MKLFNQTILALVLMLSGFSTVWAASPQTVAYVDLARYAGVWYEIGSIPQSFQKGCHCTEAKYTPREDGTIQVLNRCLKEGTWSKATGRAYIEDVKTNAKLSVGFFLPQLPIFRGEYWVIGLDAEYRYALVSNSTGSTFWLLSRTRELEPALLEEAKAIASAQGIDLEKVRFRQQEGCVLEL